MKELSVFPKGKKNNIRICVWSEVVNVLLSCQYPFLILLNSSTNE